MAGLNNYTTMMYAANKNKQFEDGLSESETQQNIPNVAHRDKPTSLPKELDYNVMDEEQLQRSYLESVRLSPDAIESMKYLGSDRDITLSLERNNIMDKYYENPDEELIMRRYLGLGVQWVSLVTENLLSHPFIVLRRQCQVYHASNYYHLHPLYLIPSIIHLHRRQGVTTLWKGLGSCLLVRGTSMAVEDILSKLTTWPKDVDNRTTLKRFGQHILLKCISITLVMPFYAASLVETVQSDIASEKPGVLDVFREGCLRLVYWSSPQKGRMLPIWALTAPTVAIGITRYLFSLIIKGISTRIIRRRLDKVQEKQGAKYKNSYMDHHSSEVYINLISMLCTETLFYPFETIIHRLQLQGTRTIIDNLDNGYAVVPILTNYHGAIDCYRATIAAEGFAGLYKGFGALILQFAAHVAVVKLTKWTVNQISELISNRPSSKVIQYYNLDRGMISNSTTISPSLSLGSDLNEQVKRTSTPIIEEAL